MSNPTSKERSLQRYRVDFGYGRYYFEPNAAGDWVKYDDVAKLIRALTNAVRNVTVERKEWYTHIAQPLQDVYQALGSPPELALTPEEIAALAGSPVETKTPQLVPHTAKELADNLRSHASDLEEERGKGLMFIADIRRAADALEAFGGSKLTCGNRR